MHPILTPIAVVVALSFAPGSRVERLAAAIRHDAGRSAYAHAIAAVAAERPGIPAELMLGQAWIESRYYPDATSRVVDGRRRTGRSGIRQGHARGPFFCGVLQAGAGRSWSRCLALRDLRTGYAAGAAELATWMAACRKRSRRNVMRCALAGYGGGWKAIGRSTYPARVMARVARIRLGRPSRP